MSILLPTTYQVSHLCLLFSLSSLLGLWSSQLGLLVGLDWSLRFADSGSTSDGLSAEIRSVSRLDGLVGNSLVGPIYVLIQPSHDDKSNGYTLSAGLVTTKSYAVGGISWLVCVGSLLGDQSNTTLWSWSDSDSLFVFRVSILSLISKMILSYLVVDESSMLSKELVLFRYSTPSNLLTFLLWVLVKLNGSLENRTPPLELRLTKNEFWFPEHPLKSASNSCIVSTIYLVRISSCRAWNLVPSYSHFRSHFLLKFPPPILRDVENSRAISQIKSADTWSEW